MPSRCAYGGAITSVLNRYFFASSTASQAAIRISSSIASHSALVQLAWLPAKHRLIVWLLASSTDHDAKSVSTTSQTIRSASV